MQRERSEGKKVQRIRWNMDSAHNPSGQKERNGEAHLSDLHSNENDLLCAPEMSLSDSNEHP